MLQALDKATLFRLLSNLTTACKKALIISESSFWLARYLADCSAYFSTPKNCHEHPQFTGRFEQLRTSPYKLITSFSRANEKVYSSFVFAWFVFLCVCSLSASLTNTCLVTAILQMHTIRTGARVTSWTQQTQVATAIRANATGTTAC